MMRRVIATWLLAAAAPAGAMTLDLYIEGRTIDTPEVRATMANHFHQVVIWVATTQGFLLKRGRTPLFCPPPSFDLGANGAMVMIDAELARLAARGVRLPPQSPAEIVLLDALERAFPCPRT